MPVAAKHSQAAGSQRPAQEKGAPYIQLPATAITLDSNGVPVDMGAKVYGASRGLVEEFMVLANELAADFLWKNNVPCSRKQRIFQAGRSSKPILPVETTAIITPSSWNCSNCWRPLRQAGRC